MRRYIILPTTDCGGAPDLDIEESGSGEWVRWDDVEELAGLLQQFIDADDRRLQAEVAETVKEILFPETMLVDLRDEFELTDD